MKNEIDASIFVLVVNALLSALVLLVSGSSLLLLPTTLILGLLALASVCAFAQILSTPTLDTQTVIPADFIQPRARQDVIEYQDPLLI